MASERKTRGTDNRASREGEDTREVEQKVEEQIATHKPHTDNFDNPYDMIKPTSKEWKFGFFPENVRPPVGWSHVKYESLDDTVRGDYIPLARGPYGNVASIGAGEILYKIKMSEYLRKQEAYQSESEVNLIDSITTVGETNRVEDIGSGEEMLAQ